MARTSSSDGMTPLEPVTGKVTVVEVNNGFMISLEYDGEARRMLVFFRLSHVPPYLEDSQLGLQ